MAIYLHETLDVVPGMADEYFEGLGRLWLPVAAKRGLRCVGFWATVGTTGRWPEAIALWEMEDWEHYARLRESQFVEGEKDERLTEWVNSAWKWRTGGFDRMLIPGEGSPTISDLRRTGVKGGVFLHEIVEVAPGRADDYTAQVISRYLPIAERRGMQLVGSWRSAFRNTEAVNIWALRDWDHWIELRATASTDTEVQAWMRDMQDLRTDWVQKLLTPVAWNPLRGDV